MCSIFLQLLQIYFRASPSGASPSAPSVDDDAGLDNQNWQRALHVLNTYATYINPVEVGGGAR